MARLSAVEASCDPAVTAEIERNLLASLARLNRQSANLRRTFVIYDHDGDLLAGLACSTAYGWLHVETLWVADAHRGQGLGRKLMATAESFGRDQACHGAWLETSSADAFAFYRKLGYSLFGELANGEGRFPVEHHRWFLQRKL